MIYLLFFFSFFRGAESLLNQGIEWEKKGEYNRAIDMYVKITPSMTTDHELVEDAMVKVSEAETNKQTNKQISHPA